jgi:glycosyltransferase involved in cell wall biosynthesis
VLHVIPAIAPRYGGPSQAVLGMSRALRAAGVEAEIAATDADGPQGRFIAPQTEAGGDVPLHLFPRTATEAFKYSRELSRWLTERAGDYDVLHVHGVFSHATAAACRAAARRGVPAIVRPCGMLAPYSLRQSRFRKGVYWRLCEARHVRSAACLHATAPGEQDELAALLPGVPVRCIPLGLDEEAIAAPRRPQAFRSAHGIPQDRPLLLFLSRLHRKKGLVDFVLPALAQLSPDLVLAVVGERDSHDPEHGALARATAKSLGLEGRVFFTGPLYRDAKWAAYDAADAYVLPSRHENFGATAIEAAARGVPSVLSHEVQAAPLAAASGAAVSVPLELSAIGAAIQGQLLLDADQRAALRLRCREFALREFSWAGTAEKLLAMYCDVAAADNRLAARGEEPMCRA